MTANTNNRIIIKVKKNKKKKDEKPNPFSDEDMRKMGFKLASDMTEEEYNLQLKLACWESAGWAIARFT